MTILEKFATVKRVLVTGATGFLGSTICRHLHETGLAFRGYVRPFSSHPVFDRLVAEKVQGDINDARALHGAMDGCDVAIHTVMHGRYNWRYRHELHRVNTAGTATFLAASVERGLKHVVIVDTISAFPATKKPTVSTPNGHDEEKMAWAFPYLQSKLAGRRIIEHYRKRLAISVVYCSPMYGAGDKHNHTGSLFQFLQRRRPVVAPPGGCSVVSVEDAAAGCILATHRDTPGDYVLAAEHLLFVEIYNLVLAALNSSHRITRVLPRIAYWPSLTAAMILDRCGHRSQFCPYLVRNGFQFRYFSASRAREILAWSTRVSIAQSIREQVDWMRGVGTLPRIEEQS